MYCTFCPLAEKSEVLIRAQVNGALTTFGTQLETSFGFTPLQVLLYDNPRSVISTLWFIIIGITSTRYRGIRMYWMIVSTIIVFVAMLVIAFAAYGRQLPLAEIRDVLAHKLREYAPYHLLFLLGGRLGQ